MDCESTAGNLSIVPPIESPPVSYHNPIRRIIRAFVVLAAIFATVGVPALVGVIHLNRPETRNGPAATTCLVVAAISLPGAIAMFLSALLTIPNARKADRCFDSFRKHDCLAEWTYGKNEWRRYVRSEEKRLRKTGWVMAGFVGVILMAVWLVIAWFANSSGRGQIIGMLFGMAAAISVAGIILGCYRLYIWTRRRRLSSCPRAFIGRNAIFCGGDFAYWGSNMLVLRSARLLEGDVPQLEFVIGTGGTALTIARFADLVNTVAGHPTGTSQMTWRYTVLVPEGRTAEAAAALSTILQPEPRKPAVIPVAKAQTVSPMAASPRPQPQSNPQPAKTARASAIWWQVTAGLLLVGLGMLLASDSVGQRAGKVVGMIGFLMWCASPVTLIVASRRSIQRWRSRAAR